MFRRVVLALPAVLLLGVSAVSAQSIEIGPRGPSIDLRNDRQRERDFRREREFEREREGRRAERFERDRTRGCRTVTVREEDEEGNRVVRRRREC